MIGCAARDYAFKAVYTITLVDEALRADLRVINTDDKPFEFTAALHSYFEVLDITKARVKGLQGLTYLDKVVHFSAATTVLVPMPDTCCY